MSAGPLRRWHCRLGGAVLAGGAADLDAAGVDATGRPFEVCVEGGVDAVLRHCRNVVEGGLKREDVASGGV